MRLLFAVLLAFTTIPAWSMEHIEEFWENYRTGSCRRSMEQARDRANRQLKSGKDTYDGPIARYKGMKILRFVQSAEGCTAAYAEGYGMLYDYHLRVEVESP